jgi:hypothetical protein
VGDFLLSISSNGRPLLLAYSLSFLCSEVTYILAPPPPPLPI